MLWSMDTEDDSKGNLELINFFNGEEHFTFENQKDALDFLEEKILGTRADIWCVNLQYDIINMFRDHTHFLEITFAGSRMIKSQIVGSQVIFKDTLNHWKMGVKKMGERIGLEKLEAKGKKSKYADIAYCRRDCEITYFFVKSMGEKYNSFGAKLKTTIGGTSLDLFTRNFYRKFTDKEVIDKETIEWMRPGYYGGRVEIFNNKEIEGRVQYWDINSLYPFCLTKEYPVLSSRDFTTKPDFDKMGVCEVEMISPVQYIPYLPMKHKKSLVFPMGKIKGIYTHFEIKKALSLGYELISHGKCLQFEKSCAPFRGFVHTLYNSRLEAQKAGDTLLSDSYKLILNNLYGKFAQSNERVSLIPYQENQLKHGDELFEDMILRKVKGEYPRHTNYIWSMYCTAYGRDVWYEKAQHVVKNKGLLLYGDTDCVVFEHKDLLFEDSKELGELKLEHEWDYAHFKLPKLYKLINYSLNKEIIKAKGVPQINQKEFFETGKTSFQKPYKMREVLRRNMSPKRKQKLIMNFWDTHSKHLNKKYDKRRILKSGNTLPLILE